MKKHKGIARILAGAFLVAVLLAALFSGGETIIIGVVGPLTGGAAPYGIAQKNGIELALNRINRDGGINGRQISAIFGDDRNDKDLAAELTRDLIYKDRVSAIIGSIEMGFEGLLFGGNGIALLDFPVLAGKAAEGVLLTFPFNPAKGGSLAQAFLEEYRSVYKMQANSFAAKGDRLWIGTSNGLAVFKGNNIREVTPDGLLSPEITSLAFDGGTLWVGTQNGVQALNAAAVTDF